MWRDDRWDETVLEIIGKMKQQGTVDLTRRALIEAGADAMLEAIWEMAKESPTGKFTFDMATINVYASEEKE